MRYRIAIPLLIAAACPTFSAELLFTKGPQEFAGSRYYWLAEWKLQITLPRDLAPTDELEVLFGSKGRTRRTLYYDYKGKSASVAHVADTDGYQWLRIPLDSLNPGETVTLYGRGREHVAFIAGIRITGDHAAAPRVKPVRTAVLSSNNLHAAVWSEMPGFEFTDENRRLWDPTPAEPDWPRAERSSQFASIALTKVRQWLRQQCMLVHDKPSGLFRPTGAVWTYRDTAADCYPFYVWAAFYTDLDLLNTVMIDTLKAEQRLCNHIDRLPVRYDMDARRKIVTDHDTMIFGASEYAKDGLVPIVEITGPDYPWFDRMRAIVDDIFKNARLDTPYGRIPSTNIEVNGELLQILPRLYSVTKDRKYLDYAHRLADHYLLPGDFTPGYLSDHGCEIIGGLGLLFAVDTTAAPEKARQYQPHLRRMFDRILERGTNSDGVIVRRLEKTPGPHDNVSTGDGWGYDFVGFLDYDLALGSQHYYHAISRPMTNLLKPRYLKFNWDSNSRDNIADSVEGALYLLHRIPVPQAFIWADREIATCLVDHTDPNRLWGVHKLEANTVRTVLIHTMLHTRNTILRPWRSDLQLGAAPFADGIAVYLKSEKPYQGRLHFDIPRHRIYMGFEKDWPRMNAVPEYFTVEPDDNHTYKVHYPDSSQTVNTTGKLLAAGMPVTLRPDTPLRIIVKPD